MARFLRIQNRVLNLDAIAYVDFLESGRAMIFMQGLTQEKQNIPVDPEGAQLLNVYFGGESHALTR
jgi:hypothetical protein